MTQHERNTSGVKTTGTAFDILEFIKEQNGARISEVADALDLAKSTVHRHLATLLDRKWVAKEGDLYRISLRFIEFGEHARSREEGYQLAREKVEELAEETRERAQFLAEEHGQGVYMFRAAGHHAVRTDPGLGKRIPLHSTAAGKAILAYLPEQQVDEIIEQSGLSRHTANTITDRDELFEELDRIRERGYSTNDQENVEGLRAVGVPVRYRDVRVLGALSVSGPTKRMKGDWYQQELPDLLRGTANEIELNLAYG